MMGPPVTAAQERSSHAPYSAGDCTACHVSDAPVAGQSAEEARLHMRLIRPVNERCASCHRELFRAPPRNHPPELAACTSCHDPHNSRQRSLLRDDETTRACLDYAPPYPAKAGATAKRAPAGAASAKGTGP